MITSAYHEKLETREYQTKNGFQRQEHGGQKLCIQDELDNESNEGAAHEPAEITEYEEHLSERQGSVARTLRGRQIERSRPLGPFRRNPWTQLQGSLDCWC